jgi:dTDP-glucose 4,6-dehydratase
VVVHKGHTRTSTYLEDTCVTLANIVDNFIPGRVYNIGGREHHDMETLVELIWKHAGADPALIEYRGEEILTTKDKVVDVSLSETDLKHQNTVSLEDGVKRTVEWMREYYKLQK